MFRNESLEKFRQRLDAMYFFSFKKRRISLKSFAVFISCFWLTGLIILHLSIDGTFSSLSKFLSDFFSISYLIDAQSLKKLMESSVGLSSHMSLDQFYVSDSNVFHFYHLPKRKRFMTFAEITTANRDTRHPLAPDFTFHIRYKRNRVTLYEDYGCGCIFRIYIYPPLPTDSSIVYSMTAKDLADLYLILYIDGVTFEFSLQQITEGRELPFLFPLNTRHPTPTSGMGTYTPLCYRRSMKVEYVHRNDFPDNLFNLTVDCTSNEMLCPVKLYSSISRHKYVHDFDVASGNDLNLKSIAYMAKLLEHPELRGPDGGQACLLECFQLCAKCQRVLHHSLSSGVISSMKFRVFSSTRNKVLPDWNKILFSAYFDGADSPQINKIPLGSIFGATASLNDFRGAAFGRRKKHCSYSDPNFQQPQLPRNAMTGYFYLPMPFWREGLVLVEGTEHMLSPSTVCYQLEIVSNHYNETTTGQLHGVKTYYDDNTNGWRSVLNVSKGWGHIVSVSMEIDNLRAIRDVPLAYRWAALQADNVIYIDGNGSPNVMGTGLEDYFSYAHGFAQAENTTYSFVGVYHANTNNKEPLTWHCYRQHILDPIPFNSAIEFVMEGTDENNYMKPARPLNYSEHWKRKSVQSTSFSHLVFYYFKPLKNDDTVLNCDKLVFCDTNSERIHFYHNYISTEPRNSSIGGELFYFENERYIGDSVHDRTLSGCGRSFVSGSMLKFTLTKPKTAADSFMLRRTSHCLPFQWNEMARLTINGISHGTWFIPMGCLTTEYSLRQEDYVIRLSNDSIYVEVILEILSIWRDVSYELCPLP